jgi:hypothetical protein
MVQEERKIYKFYVSESCLFLWRAESFSRSFEDLHGGLRSPLQISFTKLDKEIFSHLKRCLFPDPDTGLYPDPIRAKIMKKHVKR